jgi:hypothetical protein
MYRSCLYLSVALAVIFCASFANADGVCTGYPKMYNGLPCASTTRYWDGQMGACGCGTGNTSPFSWQWTKPTAAASAPIFGSGTWCGSGCGKCYKLTPTAIGASPEGSGAPALTPLVVKISNLCPYAGNEAWCAYDVNSFGYDAHFDLMDYNMAGLVSSMGWNNPEVTYEEVDCAANGYTDWNCQCASGAGTPATTTATSVTPTTAAVAPTAAPVAPTTAAVAPTAAHVAPTAAHVAPTSTPATTSKATSAPARPSTAASNIQIQVNGGSNAWWVGVSLVTPAVSAISSVEVKDASSAAWTTMSYQGNEYWNLYSANPSQQMTLPLSLRFTGASGEVVTSTNIITAFQSATLDTGVAV